MVCRFAYDGNIACATKTPTQAPATGAVMSLGTHTSLMMPEPTTAARRSGVPVPSATPRCASVIGGFTIASRTGGKNRKTAEPSNERGSAMWRQRKDFATGSHSWHTVNGPGRQVAVHSCKSLTHRGVSAIMCGVGLESSTPVAAGGNAGEGRRIIARCFATAVLGHFPVWS